MQSSASSSRWLLVAVATVSIAGFLVLLAALAWRSSAPAPATRPVQDEPSVTGAAPEAALAATQPSAAESQHPDFVRPARRAPLPRHLQVIDERGAGVPEAELSWSGASSPSPSSSADLWSLHLELPPLLRTGADGALPVDELLAAAPAERPGALWVTKPGYRQSGWLLEDGSDAPPVLELAQAFSLSVNVLDAGGEPASHAVVWTAGRPAAEGLPVQETARPLLVRSVTTDAAGRAVLPMVGDSQWVLAVRGSERSAAVQVSAPAELELRLGESSTAGGRIRVAGRADVPEGATVTVRGEPSGGSVLARAAVVEDGAWGPVPVALPVGSGALTFRLSGGGLVTTEQEREPPAPGTHVEVDFAAELGLRALVRIVDPEGEPLADARVQAIWRDGDRWLASEARTDEAGQAEIGGLVAGSLWLRASRVGYVQSTVAQASTLAQDLQEFPELTLLPAGVLAGVVLADGEPVTDFEVVTFDLERATHQRTPLAGRVDGSFMLRDRPRGLLEVFAVAPGRGVSETLTIDLGAGSAERVELELRSGGVLRGHVRHALTGEPIASAEADLFIRREGTNLGLQGRPTTCDGQGVFELAGLAPGTSSFQVSAAGFSTHVGVVESSGAELVDLGAIVLTPAQDLLVRLRAPERLDATHYQLQLKGPRSYPARPFDADGTARFEGVQVGAYSVRVFTPEGPLLDVYADLRSGAPWVVDVEVAGGDEGGLDVVVEMPPEDYEADGMNLSVSTVHGERLVERALLLPSSLRVTIPPPLGEEVLLHLFGEGPTLLGMSRVRVADHEHRPARLHIDRRVRVVQVLDPKGAPVVGAEVLLSAPDYHPGWWRGQQTDAEGLARFPGVSFLPVQVDVAHPVHGYLAGHLLDSPPADEPLVLRIGDGPRLSVRLLDGTFPLAGLRPELRAPDGRLIAFLELSDPAGRLVSPPFPAGNYTLRIDQAGHWPTDVALAMGEADTQLEVQVRRLGGLRIGVQTPGGSPVEGVELGLASQELGTSVQAWIEAGVLAPPAGGLVTDAAGQLLLGALPNGPYLWTLERPGHEPQVGSVTVPPHALGELVVTLGS